MTKHKTKYAFISAIGLLFAGTGYAQAQTAPSLSGLFACEAVTGQAAQLSCFRAETAKLRAAGGAAPLAAPLATPEPARTPEFAPLPKEEVKAPKSRTLAIVSAQVAGGKGYTRFTLENGEVWQQIESARIRLGKENPDTLTIKRASFGSFIGRVNDKRPSFRVRRVE